MRAIKSFALITITACLAVTGSIPTFAGQWKADKNGWWYQNDDGTYPKSQWKWIDWNDDNIAECYYFDSDGYMAANVSIDGSTVNGAGVWTVDGVVQTKKVAAEEETGAALTDSGESGA